MNLTEDYVSFETAKLLKEKGFDVPCQQAYFNERLVDYTLFGFCDGELIHAPSQSLALKWLREVKKIHISLYAVSDLPEEGYISEKITYTYNILDAKEPFHFFDDYDDIINPPQFNSYEQAVEAVLLYILKNLI